MLFAMVAETSIVTAAFWFERSGRLTTQLRRRRWLQLPTDSLSSFGSNGVLDSQLLNLLYFYNYFMQ